ncbi:MAG: cytochrome c maturation protein CcmE [Bacteroidia bacterium]|nr:cytochrome c maturation protein CcmE [Bacteroidia bacterium]
MKSKHIVILLLIGVGIAAIIGTYGDASTTVSFAEAAEQPDKKFHVKTSLVKSKAIEYEPEVDPEKFTFYGMDEDGEVRRVTCLKEMPFDFERSEEIKLIGHVRGEDEFVATDFQMKCPSKYENEVEDI